MSSYLSTSKQPSLKSLIQSYYEWKEQMCKKLVDEILACKLRDSRDIDMLVDGILKVSPQVVNEELDRAYRRLYVRCEKPTKDIFEALYFDAQLDRVVLWNLVKEYVDLHHKTMNDHEYDFWYKLSGQTSSSSYRGTSSSSGSCKRRVSYSTSSPPSKQFKFESVPPKQISGLNHKSTKPTTATATVVVSSNQYLTTPSSKDTDTHITQGKVGFILEENEPQQVQEEEQQQQTNDTESNSCLIQSPEYHATDDDAHTLF
jgi:hypothetical protein